MRRLSIPRFVLVFVALVLAASAPPASRAAEPETLANHEDAVYCAAIFQIALDQIEIDDKASHRRPPEADVKLIQTYRDRASKSALALGAAKGLSPGAVESDSARALAEERQRLRAGEYNGKTPESTLELYMQLCAERIDSYAKAPHAGPPARAPAAAAPLQSFYVVHVSGAYEVMVVPSAQVTTSANGHRIFPVHVISDDATVDTTVLEVDCAAKRRRVVSESVLFYGRRDPIDKTSQNDLSWQAYGSDTPADEFVCAGPGAPTQATKYEFADIQAFAVSAAATLRGMRAAGGK